MCSSDRRDCSIQRRHQKLIEEAPAPGLTEEERRSLHAMAVSLATACGLRNAATCEFLHSPDGHFWFLEVNTRLRLRLVSNNGLKALFGAKGSVPCFKIQQEHVKDFLTGLRDAVRETWT